MKLTPQQRVKIVQNLRKIGQPVRGLKNDADRIAAYQEHCPDLAAAMLDTDTPKRVHPKGEDPAPEPKTTDAPRKTVENWFDPDADDDESEPAAEPTPSIFDALEPEQEHGQEPEPTPTTQPTAPVNALASALEAAIGQLQPAPSLSEDAVIELIHEHAVTRAELQELLRSAIGFLRATVENLE